MRRSPQPAGSRCVPEAGAAETQGLGGASNVRWAISAPTKPIRLCVPSQNGLVTDPPQRQSAIALPGLLTGITLPAASTMTVFAAFLDLNEVRAVGFNGDCYGHRGERGAGSAALRAEKGELQKVESRGLLTCRE